MIIQHNIMAINAHNKLSTNNTNLSKNLEKLSSGYRINKAADDASGLAVSEKMRAQITGLSRAIMNAQDGASLIQTAEGALTEVHSMLNRMVELATQSANGTIQDDDRGKIEQELNHLKGEIDRISEATNFNGINLLDGSLSGSGSVGAASINSATIKGLDHDSGTGTVATSAKSVVTLTSAAAASEYNLTMTIDGMEYKFNIKTGTSDSSKMTINGTEYDASSNGAAATSVVASAIAAELKNQGFESDFNVKATATGIELTRLDAGKAEGPVDSIRFTDKTGTPTAAVVTANTAGTDKVITVTAPTADEIFEINGQKFVLSSGNENKEAKYAKDNVLFARDEAELAAIASANTGLKINATFTEITSGDNTISGKGGLTMQVGDTSADFNKITVSVDDMSSAGLGISGISMATQTAAAASLERVKAAIEKVSVNRGELGALQNRLEHTINNLTVTTENMTAAESRIRDVDMAKEMMQYTKNNVLSQAAQAMLAQANQQPQNVLQLLR